MNRAVVTIALRSALGGPIFGDTLLGQLCWAIRNRFGERRLDGLLQGYQEGQPFLVISDALPAGHLPLPNLPLSRFEKVEGADPKQLKKLFWIEAKQLSIPLQKWLALAVTRPAGGEREQLALQPHNSINRQTGTTGKGGFAPYQQEQLWLASGVNLHLILLHDPQRIEREEIQRLLVDVGAVGYGRDASIGLGKFEVISLTEQSGNEAWSQPGSNASITLAPSAPQGLGFNADQSFYTPFTRFGRHGGQAVHWGHPFKTPLLLARRGAIFVDGEKSRANEQGLLGYVGQGIGGDGKLSRTIPQTIHQGYAPVIRVCLGGIP